MSPNLSEPQSFHQANGCEITIPIISTYKWVMQIEGENKGGNYKWEDGALLALLKLTLKGCHFLYHWGGQKAGGLEPQGQI